MFPRQGVPPDATCGWVYPSTLGAPGNPVSTAVALRFFVGPYLRALVGMAPERPRLAKLGMPLQKPEGLRCFLKAAWRGTQIEASPGQESYRVAPLLDAEAWLVLPEAGRRVLAGDECEVYPLLPSDDGPRGLATTDTSVGGCC